LALNEGGAISGGAILGFDHNHMFTTCEI